jgi:hypothetical protein
LFQDFINLPWSPFLEGVKSNPKVNITIGGRTEKSFCALRDELSESVSPKGFRGFVDKKIKAADDDKERIGLKAVSARVENWEKRVAKSRENYWDEQAYIIRPDRPNQTIQLITSIGRLPTYYYREGYDQPYGSMFARDQLQKIQHPYGAIDERRGMPQISEKGRMRIFDSHDERELKEELVKTQRVVFDLQALRKEEV